MEGVEVQPTVGGNHVSTGHDGIERAVSEKERPIHHVLVFSIAPTGLSRGPAGRSSPRPRFARLMSRPVREPRKLQVYLVGRRHGSYLPGSQTTHRGAETPIRLSDRHGDYEEWVGLFMRDSRFAWGITMSTRGKELFEFAAEEDEQR